MATLGCSWDRKGSKTPYPSVISKEKGGIDHEHWNKLKNPTYQEAGVTVRAT